MHRLARGKNKARHIGGSNHVGVARFPIGQPGFADKDAGAMRFNILRRARAILYQNVDVAGQDQLQAGCRLALFHDVKAGRVPLYLDVIGSVAQHARLIREQHQALDEIIATTKSAIHLDQPLDQQP